MLNFMMDSQLKKFLINLVFFVVVLIGLDRLLGYGFRHFYFHQKNGEFAQMTYALDSTKADILIFGSSRALHHYSSPIIADRLKLSCYNTGKGGQKIPFATALQEVILKRYKPKIIILDLLLWDVTPGPEKFTRLSALLPYCNEHPELVKYLSMGDKNTNIKLLSKTYPYDSFLFLGVLYNLFPSYLPKITNGYIALDRTIDQASYDRWAISEKADSVSFVKYPDESLDEGGIAMYKAFLLNAQAHHIKTYLVFSPFITPPSIRFKKKVALLKAIAKTYTNTTFLDFSTDPDFSYHYKKFADVSHLNKTGAEEFSKKLAGKLVQAP